MSILSFNRSDHRQPHLGKSQKYNIRCYIYAQTTFNESRFDPALRWIYPAKSVTIRFFAACRSIRVRETGHEVTTPTTTTSQEWLTTASGEVNGDDEEEGDVGTTRSYLGRIYRRGSRE